MQPFDDAMLAEWERVVEDNDALLAAVDYLLVRSTNAAAFNPNGYSVDYYDKARCALLALPLLLAEVRRLRAESETLRTNGRSAIDAGEQLIAVLHKERDAAREDVSRLEWLGESDDNFTDIVSDANGFCVWTSEDYYSSRFAELRAAIDAARARRPSPKEAADVA